MPARIAASERRNGIGRCVEIQAVPADISASAIVSQPFSSAKVSASASAASVPVANSAIEACSPGRSSRLARISVAARIGRRQHHRDNRKRDRAVEMRDAGVERDQQRQRREHRRGRPDHRDDRRCRSGPAPEIRRRRTRPRRSRPMIRCSDDRSVRGGRDRCPATGRRAAPACPDWREPPIRRIRRRPTRPRPRPRRWRHRCARRRARLPATSRREHDHRGVGMKTVQHDQRGAEQIGRRASPTRSARPGLHRRAGRT